MSTEAVACFAPNLSGAITFGVESADTSLRGVVASRYFRFFRRSQNYMISVGIAFFVSILSANSIHAKSLQSPISSILDSTKVVPVLIGNQTVISVVGERITKGNAVDCPKIRSADGTETPVSHLPADISIGAQVEVSGYMAVTTKCVGKVLYVQNVRKLED